MSTTKRQKNPNPQPKRAKRRANREKKIEKMIKASVPSKPLSNGTTGANVRSTSTVPAFIRQSDDQSIGSINTIPVYVPVKDRSVAYLAMGIVLRAIQYGSEAAQVNQQVPYYQFRYLYDTFLSVMQSGVLPTTTAPQWFWEILYALKPKEGKFKTGKANYTWVIKDTGLGVDQVFTLGTGEDNYSIYWGTGVANLAINGLPVLGPVPTYTQELGLAAIASLWPYVSKGAVIADPGPDNVWTGYDTSAFAVVYPELGESYFSEGAVRTTLYSERHIDSPLFCQFGIYQDPGSLYWRGWHQARVGSGSPCMIGPTLCELPDLKHLRNKLVPIIKFYNFDEFFEQLSLTVGLALERGIVGSATICPLTAQQVAILLRQAILQVTSNHVAQDVRYSGDSFVNMLPFTVGPNGTNGGQTIAMQLPTFLAENIRAIAT